LGGWGEGGREGISLCLLILLRCLRRLRRRRRRMERRGRGGRFRGSLLLRLRGHREGLGQGMFRGLIAWVWMNV